MWPILVREFNAFLNSLIAYIVIGVFIITIGLFMWVFPQTSVLEFGFADMSTLFNMAPFVFLFLIPAITMRSFAEEKRNGTIELLFTQPVSDFGIVMGKYLADILLLIISLLPTLIFYYTIYQLGMPLGNIDSAGVAGSYIGLILLGASFTSIGIFCSSLTDNQIVAFISSVFLSYLSYVGFDYIAGLSFWGSASTFISSLGIDYHYKAMSKGLIDSRDLCYFLTVIVVFVYSTKLVLSSRKW